MPNGDKLKPKTTREHLLWVLLGTVGAVSLLLLEKVLDKNWLFL